MGYLRSKLSFGKPRGGYVEPTNIVSASVCENGVHGLRVGAPRRSKERLSKKSAMSMRHFGRDEHGGVLVEVTVMIPIIFVFVLGSIDFLFAFYQWNAAAKAVEVGARIAAVSTPVANGLIALSGSASSIPSPQPMPYFKVTCSGSGCSCTGTCTGVAGYNAAAMHTIVFGRGSSACNDATSSYYAGMCDVFNRVTPGNVRIVYEQTGLGYLGRPGGPVPTVTVSLQALPFQFFFLGGLLSFANIPNIPASATITGEDLDSSGGP